MPSNYTPNYQLNQWEADDRVLRTDFNADNARIDAAIKAQADGLAAEKKALNTEKAAREAAVKAEADARAALAAELRPRAGAQLITEVTLEKEESLSHVVPMADFNWNEWLAVYIEVGLKVPDGAYGDLHFYVNDTQVGELLTTSADKRPLDVFLFLPFFNDRNYVWAWPITSHSTTPVLIPLTTYQKITKFKINSGAAIGVGTFYRIWGIK